MTDAYITWALSESGQSGIDAEVKHSIELGRKSDDAYVVALAAATALNANQQDEGRKLLEKLAKAQADDGHLDSRQGSITRSGGQSLQVETTALAALAWLKSPEFAVQAEKAVKWIVAHRQGGGGFGSTQATILALKALVEHAKANRRTANAGTLTRRTRRPHARPAQFQRRHARNHRHRRPGSRIDRRRQPPDDQSDRRQQDALHAERQLPHAQAGKQRRRAPCGW